MADEIFGKDDNELTLVIEDTEITVESARLLRTMDTGADALTCTMPWEPGLDDKIDEITAPFSYSECAVYLGNHLAMIGVLYNVTQSRTNAGTKKDLEIYSPTADLIDSTVVSPYEENNVSLTDRCKKQCEPFGIDVVIGDGVNLLKERRVQTGRYQKDKTKPRQWPEAIKTMRDIIDDIIDAPKVNTKGTWKVTGEKIVREEQKFSRVSAKQTDTIWKHLSGLAAQRGLLLDCTKYGDLLITKANTTDTPVATIQEGNPIANDFVATFDGRKRFNIYRALASSSRSGKSASASSAKDEVVILPRLLTFRSQNNLPGEAPNAADWRKNKSVAEALTIPFPVNSWYDPNGNLWEPNTKVTVISPTIGLTNGYTFLINQVEFNYKADGATANLKLVPPSVYTIGELDEPWVS
jgi:prophage tail gpP-like protein